MFDICLLGTGGMMPLPYRYLTSLMIRYNGSQILIDCGEGTQVAIKKRGWSFKNIDIICITHFHGDHISGLPGLLLTMGNSDRTKDLTIIGPKGVERVCESLRVVARDLPFSINYVEIDSDEFKYSNSKYNITAFKVEHRITCYGYSVSIDRAGKFDVDKANKLNIPIQYWSLLQKGEDVEYNGEIVSPDMVLGSPRKGIKVTYCTDTRPCQNLISNSYNSDLLILEGMYGTNERDEKAKEYKHMSMIEACSVAKIVKPKELWLTHYSPAEPHPSEYIDELRKIYNDTYTPKDGWIKELKYEEE